MSGILRTVGVAMLAASALPVAAFTGLASIILILVFIFSPEFVFLGDGCGMLLCHQKLAEYIKTRPFFC